MSITATIQNKLENKLFLPKTILKGIFCSILLVFFALAFASKGGGDKKKNTTAHPEFAPISISSAFTLKNGTLYMGSHVFSTQKDKASISINTMVTYEKGNSIYIMPYKYRIGTDGSGSNPTNLQLFNLKIKMHK